MNLLSVVRARRRTRAWAVGEWGTRIYTDGRRQDLGRTTRSRSTQAHPQFVWLSLPDQERVRKGEKVYEDVGLTDVSCLPAEPEPLLDHRRVRLHLPHRERRHQPGRTPSWERGEIVGGRARSHRDGLQRRSRSPTTHARAACASFAKQIVDQQHLNVAIEPRGDRGRSRAFGQQDDPTPLFEILEARTQEIQAVLEEAGMLSDRIRTPRRAALGLRGLPRRRPGRSSTATSRRRKADYAGRRGLDLPEPVPVHGALRGRRTTA